MLIYNNQLNHKQLQAVNNLAALCQEADGNSPPLYPHILEQKRINNSNVLYAQEGYLLGFLSVFFFFAEACEISVIVAPSHRRQGIAKSLIQTVMPLLEKKQIATLLFSAPTAICEHWLTPMGFNYHHSEYRMQRHSYEPIFATKQRLTFRKATQEDIPTLCAIDELCFPNEETGDMTTRFINLFKEHHYDILLAIQNEEIIGKAHIHWQHDNATFSDIAILPIHQKQGLGSELLAYCINQALTLGITQLILDVETSNHNALNLYTRYDFKISNAIDFWSISTNRLKMHL